MTGLLVSSTFTVNYKINGVAQTAITGVTSDGTGAGSFTSANMTAANDGQTLQITGLTKTSGVAPNCTQSFTQNVTLQVNPLPTLTGATQASRVCEGSGAQINMTGLLVSSTFTVNYKINGVVQTAITGVTSNGAGAGSFTSANMTAANDGQTLQITGLTKTSGVAPNCTQSFTQNVTLQVNPLPTLTGATLASEYVKDRERRSI